MLKLETLDSYDKFVELKPIWNSLLTHTDVDIPFMTFEWLSCWWKGYGKNSTLLIILVKDDGEIIGIAPFMISKLKLRGITTKAITFLANYHSNRFGLILYKHKKEVTEHILKFIKDSGYKFDLLFLDFIANDSDTDTMLTQVLNENKYKFVKKRSQVSPFIPITFGWDEYLKTRSKNFRYKLHRTKNDFDRNGNYEIVKYTHNDTTKAMNELLTVSRMTWKFKENTCIVNNPEEKFFYSSLAIEAAQNGWLNIWILKLDQMPIAFMYNLEYKNNIFFLKSGFDERFRRLSPSVFLNNTALKDCFENRKKEFDCLGGSDIYKLKWTSLCREHTKYYIFNNNVLGSILQFLELKIIEPVKKSQFLTNFFKKSRKLFFAEVSR